MAEHGVIVAVVDRPVGDELADDHATGVSELQVKDAYPFLEEGAELTINGDVYAYTGWDDDTSIITLAGVTTADYEAGTSVLVSPQGRVKTAIVVLAGQSESIPVLVPHNLYASVREGVRDPNAQESIRMHLEAGTWIIDNIEDLAQTLDGALVDDPNVITLTNLCSDPKPANYLNWVGGAGGGIYAYGYAVANDSTYVAQGLHVKITHGVGGGEGQIVPNGNSFPIDPYDPGGYGNALGAAVRTYRITDDLDFAMRVYSTHSCQVNVVLHLFEADGTELSHSITSGTYLSNNPETAPALTHVRYRTRIFFDALIAAYPTLDSIAVVVGVGGGVADALSWVGSCMVTASGTLPDGVDVYRDSDSFGFATNGDDSVTGLVDLRAIPEWSDIKGRPDAFYVAPAPVTVASQAAMLALVVLVGQVVVRSDTSETYELAVSPASTLGNWTKIAVTSTSAVPAPVTVASQAAMLALTAVVGQVAVRSDTNRTYALTALPASTLGNWLLIAMTAVVAADVTGFNTAVRTSRLDQMATPTADVSMNSHKITDVTDPSSAQDAATKNYVDTAGGGGGGAQVDTYTTYQSAVAWSKPAGAKYIRFDVAAGGAGGGSGRRGAAGAARAGGGGGGAGGVSRDEFDGATFPATVYLWVGWGGAGGAAVAVDSTNGNTGSAGGKSYVTLSSNSNDTLAKDLAFLVATPGQPAGPAINTTVTGGTGGTGLTASGGAGGQGNITSALAQRGFGGGGAGSAGITAANVVEDNSLGYTTSRTVTQQSLGETTPPNTQGTNGADGSTAANAVVSIRPGAGGTSSKGASAAAAGRGGHGAQCAGGGGGGSTLNGFASGAGGNGGAGYIVITTTF